jgi:hypothetical protein
MSTNDQGATMNQPQTPTNTGEDQRKAQERRYQHAIEGWLASRIRARARAWHRAVAAATAASRE